MVGSVNLKGSVPVSVAAEVYGKDVCWVRAGLITGALPIGHATRNGKRITYRIRLGWERKQVICDE